MTKTAWKAIRTTATSVESLMTDGFESAAVPGETVLRARVTERVQTGVVYTTFTSGIRRESLRRTTLTGRPNCQGVQGHMQCRRRESVIAF